jgi:hypothetical protein
MSVSISRRAFLVSVFAAVAPAQSPAVTREEQTYKNIPGNEFSFKFTSKMTPEGRSVTIDPDDMMPIIDKKSRIVLTPRVRFLEKINLSMPQIRGYEPKPDQVHRILNTKEGESVDGGSVASKFHHLVSVHEIPLEQINMAMWLCHKPRGLEPPGPPPMKLEAK